MTRFLITCIFTISAALTQNATQAFAWNDLGSMSVGFSLSPSIALNYSSIEPSLGVDSFDLLKDKSKSSRESFEDSSKADNGPASLAQARKDSVDEVVKP